MIGRGGREISATTEAASAMSAVLAAAAAARAARVATRAFDLVEAGCAAPGGRHDPQPLLAILRGLRTCEELANGEYSTAAELGPTLDRIMGMRLAASLDVATLRTRIVLATARGAAARTVVAIAYEMLHVAEVSVRGADGAELSFAAYDDDGWLMMSVQTSADALCVLPRSAAAAMARVRTVAALAGGAVRRQSHDGRLGIAFTAEFEILAELSGDAAPAPGRPA